jgi:hypothetical protein
MLKSYEKEARYKKNSAVVYTEFEESAIFLDLNTK